MASGSWEGAGRGGDRADCIRSMFFDLPLAGVDRPWQHGRQDRRS